MYPGRLATGLESFGVLARILLFHGGEPRNSQIGYELMIAPLMGLTRTHCRVCLLWIE